MDRLARIAQHIATIAGTAAIIAGIFVFSQSAEAQAETRDEAAHRPDAIFFKASRGGDPERIKSCLRQVAAVDIRDSLGATPLMYAAEYGHAEALKLLLEAKANANARDSAGETPLMYAARDTLSTCIPPLLIAHADINARDTNGFTPLMIATIGGNYLAAQKLIYSGANLGMKDAQGEDALSLATKFHHTRIAEFLIEISSAGGEK